MTETGQELIPAEEQNGLLPALPEKQTDAIMVMIQSAALNPEAVQVMEKLWEMQKESQDRDAKAAYAKARARAQKKMPASIAANQENKHTHSTYSDLTAVNTLVVPIYSAAGFSLSFNTGVSELQDHIRIIAELMHEQGHSQTFGFDLPIDNVGTEGKPTKTLIHGKASTITYGQRYLTCLIWNIATGHDNDGNVGGPKSALPPYPDENFNANFQKWKELIENGERKVGDIMTLIESKGKLTDDQKTKLRAIKPRNQQ